LPKWYQDLASSLTQYCNAYAHPTSKESAQETKTLRLFRTSSLAIT
jgi:hypothetical protein